MIARRFLICAILILLFANGANAARYQRTKDGKTIVWNNLRGVAQDATWSGLHDSNGYATGEGTLTWYRLNELVNSYTGKMVHGKFEGPVIKEQGQTRLQAAFANGEKISNWVEPGSTANQTPTPTPTPKKEPTETPTVAPTETETFELPTPIPSPSPSRTPTPTSTPTPRPTATATPRSTSTFTPMPTPASTPTATPTITPPVLRSFTPSPAPERSPEKKFRLEETVEGPQDSLRLTTSPSPSRDKLEEVPWNEPPPSAITQTSPAASASPRAAVRTSPTPIPKNLDAKRRAIAEFKQQTDSVLAEVADATGNFRAIDDFAKVQALPAPVSTKITLLANQASVFRSKVGYETAIYECLAQIETVEALIIVDQFTGDLAAKDAPAARHKLVLFLQRYPRPNEDSEKPLWNYLTTALSVATRTRDDAQVHLKKARSLEADGKKSEALSEYQEIYQMYPNHITADAIKALEKEH